MASAHVYALDTHAFALYATGHVNKLGPGARRAVGQFEEGSAALLISAVVVWEIWNLVLAGRLRAKPTLEAWWRRVARPGLLTPELSVEDVLRAASLRWEHRDPFDRLIVATALRHGCPLVTKDAAITDWGGVEVVW